MSFAKLFTRLSAAAEEVTSPGHRAFTRRKETDDGNGGNDKKRGAQGEQTGPHTKKRCYRAQTTRTYNTTEDKFKAKHYRMHTTDSEHPSVDFTEELRHYRNQADHVNMSHKGQKYKTRSNHNVNKQQEPNKKTEGRKTQHQQRDRGRSAYSGPRKRENYKQEFQENRTRFMTQEFKDQNVMVVDGRSLCRHFIYGRCIKGNDCQLEHVQGYNNLVKDMCKFYVQGFCAKGDSCPYMHNVGRGRLFCCSFDADTSGGCVRATKESFPCKFFHRKGKCSKGEDCRFSHEQLNELTSKLLDEALKQESELLELAKRAEQESTGQPADTDESKIIEATRTPDVLKQPLRPNFYRSGDTNAEQEALFCQPEEVVNNMVEAVPPHASDADQHQSPPSTNLTREEPVCYSVEAVLGPQLSKPFSRFLTTPRSQGSTSLSTSDGMTGSANQSKVPYSVDAVLRSFKSVEHSSFGDKPIPPTAQTASFTPKTHFEEITDAQLSSETPNKEALNSVNTRKKPNKSKERLFKSLPSLQVHTSLVSETFPNCTVAYGDNKKEAAQTASHGVKSELLSTDTTYSVTCKGEGVLPSGPSSQMSSSGHHAQLRPHLSGLVSDSQGSFKPFCPSSGPIKSNDSAVSVSHYLAPKQPPKIYMHSKETQSGRNLGSKQHYSTEAKAECSRKMVHCGDSSAGCKKTTKSPYRSLFASPITDTPQPIDNCVTSSSCCRDLIQPSCTAPQTSDSRGTHLKITLEPDKASARPFLSLFAAPLSAAPLPCVQSQPDHSKNNSCSKQSVHSLVSTSLSPDSKQKASNVEESLQYPVSHTSRSPDFSSDAEMGKDGSTVHINQPVKQLVNPVCSPTCSDDSPSTTTAHQHNTGSAETTAANSVLKTLFLSLSPYHQDGECVTSGIEEKDKSSTGCVFVKQQQKNKLKKRDSHKQSTEKSGAHSRQPQPFLWTPRISLEATGRSTLSCPGTTEPPVRDFSTQNLTVVPLMQHDTQPRLKNTSEEAMCVNGNATATPLKDLFKTLDTTVVHSGL